MEVGSVNGSASAAVTASRQAQQQVEERKPKAEAQQEPPQQEAPKPVKNAQGQTTGSVINVTARASFFRMEQR
jgi:hypothetical protein